MLPEMVRVAILGGALTLERTAEGAPLTIPVAYPGRIVYAQV